MAGLVPAVVEWDCPHTKTQNCSVALYGRNQNSPMNRATTNLAIKMEEEKKEEVKPDKEKESEIDAIARKVKNRLSSEYNELLQILKRPSRFLWSNFLMGVVRGIGIAIGVTILGGVGVTIVLLILGKMAHAPLLGHFVSRLMEIIKGTAANRIY